MTAHLPDSKNLRFYANLFREHQWQTDVLHWSVFAATLDEIAARLDAAPPMVLRATGRTIPDLTKREHVCEWQDSISGKVSK